MDGRGMDSSGIW